MFPKTIAGPIVLAFVLIAIGLITFVLTEIPAHEPEPTSSASQTPAPTGEAMINDLPATTTQTLDSTSINGVAQEFTFSADIPRNWKAEAVPKIDAINLYDPAADGDTTLEQSQIFIRFFTASSFQTLSTVTIHEQNGRVLDNRPAMAYVIEKKTGIDDFAYQPSWRNLRHTVTDIRATDASPSVFYVLAARPGLDPAVYEAFLMSFDASPNPGLADPITDWQNRITKKPFGLYAEPGNSPVNPEHFTGYHTAVDIEYEDITTDVPVFAITDGEVTVARTASGYGGVVIIEHRINNEIVYGIYGHLDPAQLPKIGAQVSRGDQLGILGEGYTSETDTERKHLHFGLRRSPQVITGYVQTESELSGWYNPTIFYD